MGSNRVLRVGLKKGLIVLVTAFLLFSTVSFADTSTCTGDSCSPTIDSSAVDNKTDLSIAYLSQVFGTVGTVIHGTSGQMLGKLFYTFNQGILVVFGLWLGCIATMLGLKSANEGSFMGDHRKSATLLFLRISCGAGLLIPNATTGYSALQGLFMQVVVEGVKLADQTWEYGLDYINNGGSLWYSPDTTSNDGTPILTDSQAKTILGPTNNAEDYLGFIQGVFASEVCMVASTIALQNQGPTSATQQYNFIENADNHTFYFPGMGNDATKSDSSQNACGQVDWATIPSANCQNGTSAGNNTACGFAGLAVSGLVEDLLPAAQKYACNRANEWDATHAAVCSGLVQDDEDPNLVAETSDAFLGALINYTNAIYPVMSGAQNAANAGAKDFIAQAKADGWTAAGRYYWDLSRIQTNITNSGDISNFLPKSNTIDGLSGSAYNVCNTTASNPPNFCGVMYLYSRGPANKDGSVDSEANTFASNARAALSTSGQANNSGDTGGAAGSLPANIALSAFLPVVGDIANLFASFDTNDMGSDPILFLHWVGMKSIALAGDIWFGVGVIFAVLIAVSAVCKAVYDANAAFQMISDWTRPLFMMIAGLFLEAGIMFAFYLPIYPFVIYTVSVIGWLILVIEAMAAAPLICLGLTHPDGQPFIGRAEQGLMIILNVFLRPTLMVIGLIAGMILSYVSLRILVYGYSGFINDLFTSPQGGSAAPGVLTYQGSVVTAASDFDFRMAGEQTGSPGGTALMLLLVSPFMLAIFASLVSLVTMHCFSMVFRLPDYIMRWVGGGREDSSAQQVAEGLKGSMGKLGGAMAPAMERAGAEGNSESIRESRAMIKGKIGKNQQASLNRNGSGSIFG